MNNFLVAYMVGPEGKGLIYLLQFISGGIGLTLLSFGLGPTAIFYLSRDRGFSVSEIATGVFCASLLLGILPMAILGPLWSWVGPMFTPKVSAGYVWLALAMIPAMTLTFNVGYICLGRGQIRAYNWLRVAPSILFFLLLILLLPTHQRRIWLVCLLWVASVALPSCYALALIRRWNGARHPRNSTSFLRIALQFGWRSHLGAVTQYLQHRVDVLLVGYFLSLADLGIYAFAVSLAELLWYLPQAVGPVLMPHVAASSDDDARRLTPIVCRATLGVTALLSFALVAASACVIPAILPGFRSSIPVLWMLLPGIVVASIFKVLSSDFNGRGKPLKTLYPASAALFACIVGGLLIIPRYGIIGEAVVTTAGYSLNSVLYLRSYSRITAVPIRDLLLLRRTDFFSMNQMWQAWRSQSTE